MERNLTTGNVGKNILIFSLPYLLFLFLTDAFTAWQIYSSSGNLTGLLAQPPFPSARR